MIFKYLKKTSEIWPVLAFVPAVLGYISFFSYAYLNKLYYVNLELTTVIGLGLYNVIVLLILYLGSSVKIEPPAFRTVLILSIIQLFTFNPKYLFSIIFIYVGLSLLIKRKKKRVKSLKDSDFSVRELRIKSINRQRKELKFSTVNQALISLCYLFAGIFIDQNILIQFIFVMIILDFLNKRFQPKLRAYVYSFLIVLSVPVFTGLFFIEKADATLFGISSEKVEVYLNDSDRQIDGILKYKDSEFIYLSNVSDSISMRISLDEIESIYSKNSDNLRESYIDLFKSLKEILFFSGDSSSN